MSRRVSGRLGTGVVVGVSLVASVIAVELLLRALLPNAIGYSVQFPGSDWTVVAAPGLVRGVTGVAHFTVNRLGVRGPLFGPDSSEYRILAVGGSTTESAQLDDSEVWTSLLARDLRRTALGRPVWVGNVGRSGLTSRDHVLHLKYLLPQYPRIDAVLVLAGANDLMSALQRGWEYRQPAAITDPAGEREAIHRSFTILPPDREIRTANEDGAPIRWYRQTAAWQFARRVKMRFAARQTFRLAEVTALAVAREQRRRAAAYVDSLPPLEAPLAEFRRNLDAMAEIASGHRVRLVLVTQPALWRKDMPGSEARLLWFGWLGPDRDTARAYYTTGVLERGLAAYNRLMREVCRRRGVECVDAAAALSGDSTVFYDDVHFTEAGSRKLAGLLAAHFASRPPFVPATEAAQPRTLR